MMLLVSSARVTVGLTARSTKVTRSSALKATFFDNIQKSFGNTFSSMTESKSKYFTVGITGSSGLVGKALRDELSGRDTVNGKPVRVVRLTRGDVAEDKELEDTPETTLQWNPRGEAAEDILGPTAASEIDAFVHLAGENVATGLGPLGFLGIRPWTDEKKAEILNSRVGPTQAIAKVVGSSPTPKTLLCASGVGGYGDNFIGDSLDAVDESADITATGGFLAEISRQWEDASAEAKTGKNRVVNMRFGVVMSTQGGALGKLYPIFFLGGGGNVGSGQQYFSFISARDISRAIVHSLETPSLQGPVNLCAPVPCTNAEFTTALGKAISRPTILPFPGFAVSLLFGEMGEEMLLGGVRAVPSKLVQSGFTFLHPTIDDAIESALKEKI